jgi:hypothetical protein
LQEAEVEAKLEVVAEQVVYDHLFQDKLQVVELQQNQL